MLDTQGNEIQKTVEEENKTVSEVTNEEVTEIKEVNEESKTEEQKEAVEKKGIFDTIKSFVTGKKEQVNDEPGDTIPAQFIEAAEAAGLTEQQIIDFATKGNDGKEYSDEQLLSQIPYLKQPDSETAKVVESETKKEVVKELKKEGEKEQSDTEKKLADALTRIEQLETSDKQKLEQNSQQRLVAQATRVTSALDDLSKEYGVFATYESLPRFPNGMIIPNSPANVARNQVWGLTQDLVTAGKDFETSLQIAISSYKGQNLEKDAQRNVIKDLKRNEKRLTPKHSSHEKTVTKPESGADVVRQAGKKHGLEIR